MSGEEGTKRRRDEGTEGNAPHAPRSLRWLWPYLILLGILVIGAGLRVARVDYGSLTFDEMWHVELATGRGSPHVRVPEDTLVPDAPAVTSLEGARPWHAVWTNMDFVVHPPLYCTLLRIWLEAFGESDVSARSLSIVLSLVAITLMFLTGWRLNGLPAAAWAAGIWAVAPSQIYMAQQVRGYDLLIALGMGAAWALVRLEQSQRAMFRVTSILALCVLGMMLSHYFGIGPCVAMGVYALLRLREAKLRHAIGAAVFAVIAFLVVWGSFFWSQRQNVTETADPWLLTKGDPSQHVLNTLYSFATWPWRLVSDTAMQTPFPLMAAAVLVVPLFLLRKQRGLLIWVLWVGGTLGFVTCLDLFRGTRQLDFLRYVSFATPGVFMLAMASLARTPVYLRHGVPALVVLAALLSWNAAYRLEEPDWRRLGQTVDAHVRPGEAIIFYHGRQANWYDEILYLGTAHYSNAFPRPMIRLSGPVPRSLVEQLPGETALLVSWPLERNVADLLPGVTPAEEVPVKDLAVLTRIQLNKGGGG